MILVYSLLFICTRVLVHKVLMSTSFPLLPIKSENITTAAFIDVLKLALNYYLIAHFSNCLNETNLIFYFLRRLLKEQPIISSPMLLNPKYLTGEKWHNVIFTVPDPKMKTRTPVPPPRKKRRSLINICTKRNKSVEYINLCSCQNDLHYDQNIFDSYKIPKSRIYSSEPELFKKSIESYVSQTNNKEVYSKIKRCVSYENVASLRALCQVIKTRDKTNVLHSYINRCLLCYINEIMSRLEQLNRTNNDEYKFNLDDATTYDSNEHCRREIQLYESEEEDEQQNGRTILDEETKLSEINEQKLLESLENFCIHCYLNKIQNHPKVQEDISSSSTKVEENNLKSSQTGDNNNFSLENRNSGNKISPLGNTHDKKNVHANFTVKTKGTVKDEKRACANYMQTQSFPQPQYSCLDKKYECLFCCINKKKKKEKHYNSGSLSGIYSKKQKYNVFKSDNTNEQECKYTIGNKVGNKIRNEKLREINNAQNKSMHTHSNNMLEHFKNLNCCRRRHLNLFKFMCFQCFYVYIQILYVLQSSALFEEDLTRSLFKMRKCELMRDLSIQDIRTIVFLVQQIHIFFYNNSIESNICKSCTEVLSLDDEESDQKQTQGLTCDKNQCEGVNDISSVIRLEKRSPTTQVDAFTKKYYEIDPKPEETEVQKCNQICSGIEINNNVMKKESSEDASISKISNLKDYEDKAYERNEPSRIGFITTKKKLTKAEKNTENTLFRNKKTEIEDNLKFNKTLIGEVRNKTASSNPVDSKINVRNNNKIIQKLENKKDPCAAEIIKIKFEQLKADLHAKKIQCEDTDVFAQSHGHGTDLNILPLMDAIPANPYVADSKRPIAIEHKKVFDANGNYLEISVKVERKSPRLSIAPNTNSKIIETNHSNNPLDLTDSTTDTFRKDSSPSKYFPRRNSIKRKSYKLKYPPESNHTKDLLQIPGGVQTRRSSVTDSLDELEASLDDMLQNNFAMEDVEYV